MKTKIISLSILLGIATLFSIPVFSQPSNPPGGDGGGDPVGDETDVPFGIEWLVAGGIAYGVTKFKKNKKNKSKI